MFRRACLLGLTAAVFVSTIAQEARADHRRPGSLLVFPIFDNRPGVVTLLSVTNTNQNWSNGSVTLEYVYRKRDDCNEFNRTRHLTPGDTLTVVTKLDNPNSSHTQGYVYVFAKNAAGAAVAFDFLIGTTRVYSADLEAYEIGPFIFRSGNRMPPHTPTDLDGDGVRDLNGFEYEPVGDEMLVPSFLGQIPGQFESSLVLINLSGSEQFTAFVNLWIFNDNEEAFSDQIDFRCWKRFDLLDISGAFSKSFLLSTNDDPGDGPAYGNESGWIRIDGNVANSTAGQINDPAILAVRIEPLAPYSNCHGAVLPFEVGLQNNGDLLLSGIFGDSTP